MCVHLQVGGSTPLGAWGYIECIRELKTQLEEAGDGITDIFVACGSGGSAAGIALAVKLAGMNVRVHAVIVSLRVFTYVCVYSCTCMYICMCLLMCMFPVGVKPCSPFIHMHVIS